MEKCQLYCVKSRRSWSNIRAKYSLRSA